MGLTINCECKNCSCTKEFERIETEELFNLIQHGRLTPKQIEFLKTRIGSKLCKQCFIENHKLWNFKTTRKNGKTQI